MEIYTTIKVEIKEDKILQGNEISIIGEYIYVSPELYKILSVVYKNQKEVNRILSKAKKLTEGDLILRHPKLYSSGTQQASAPPPTIRSSGGRRSAGWKRRLPTT